MKSKKESGDFRPFKGLGSLLKTKAIILKSDPPNVTDAHSDGNPNPDEEQKLFFEAMADVKPISKGKYIERKCPHSHHNEISNHDESDEYKALLRLKRLVQSGEGFKVADTSEYIDGVGHHVHPAITKYLHQGNFSIQAHIDLHGLSVAAAQEVLDQFFLEAIRTGKRTVLIVHGRGLSSPDKPILKSKVYEWLTTGVWRKWVLAFTSARHCDGGGGGTYVLLRRRPVTKKSRKRR